MSTTGATVHTTNAVSLADEEEVKQVLLNSVLGLWDVVNDLTRLGDCSLAINNYPGSAHCVRVRCEG